MSDAPQPLLKWAGGKRALTPWLVERYAAAGSPAIHVEPFLGSGAAALALTGLKGGPSTVIAADASPFAWLWWRAWQDAGEITINEVWDILSGPLRYSRGRTYYKARDTINGWFSQGQAVDYTRRAEIIATLYYVNKTCYNGLVRFNAKGGYNVPYAKDKEGEPIPLPARSDLQAHAHLGDVLILEQDWTAAMTQALRGWRPGQQFVYADPPYQDVFSAYAPTPWGAGDLRSLAAMLAAMAGDGCAVYLSEHDKPIPRNILGSQGLTICHRWIRQGRIARTAAGRTDKVEAVYTVKG